MTGTVQRPAASRRGDVDLGLRVEALLRAQGVAPCSYRSTHGANATKGRWKGFVIEYSPSDDARPGKRWSDVRLVVERGVLTICGCSLRESYLVTPGTLDLAEAAQYLVDALRAPCLQCQSDVTSERLDLMCSACKRAAERIARVEKARNANPG